MFFHVVLFTNVDADILEPKIHELDLSHRMHEVIYMGDRENRAQYYLDKVMSRRTLQIGRLPDFGFAEESMFLLDTNCLSDEHRAVELITKTVGFFEREANKRVNNLSGFWEVLAKTEGMV